MKSNAEGPFIPELLQQYAIDDVETGIDEALQNGGGKIPTSGTISVKSSKSKVTPGIEKGSHKTDKKRSKDKHDSTLGKRKKSKLT